MSGNSSSFNDSLLQPNQTSIIFPLQSTIYYITSILLLLPLCTFILYLGLQRWRQQRSTNTAAMTSHSDVFTYHMVTFELVGVSGRILGCYSGLSGHVNISMVGYSLWLFSWFGEIFFHVLTCFEWYLAVVHPITYMNLRGERGIRIRNIIIGCVWVISIGVTPLVVFKNILLWIDVSLLLFSLVIITFCSLSVLCILIRPGPGEQGGDREGVDQSKQRAFYTIVAILGVLVLKCVCNLVWNVRFMSRENEPSIMYDAWFTLPSSLVLPLLYLHRDGKLACCTNNSK